MRLHHLTVTAVGPFAGTEHVDFEQLNEAGLFLLTGPTGAGKSSLLDAVCFALYGTVPGVRGVKTLKSQHATAEVVPEVVLDFGVQGRRFVVRRTPEWSRPKKRGDGLLTEKASASITETTTGIDHFLSSRAAEVGLLVTDLMGMNAAQFQQVALLPQGEFQTFLRASSQERHDVLQHLFRTDRFARIEDWVNDHSRRLKHRAGAGESTVQRILDTVADRAGASAPDDLSGESLAAAAAAGRVLPWATSVLADARVEAELSRTQHHEASAALDAARRRHEVGARRAEQRVRFHAARQALLALEESKDAAAAGRAVLAAHDRATRCVPVLALHGQAVRVRDETTARRDRAALWLASSPAWPAFGEPAAPISHETVSAALDAVRSRVARLEALLPRERAASDAGRERDAELVRLQEAEAALLAAVTRAEQVPDEIESATARLAVIGAKAARHDAVMLALETARSRHAAADELTKVQVRLVTLEDLRRDARDGVQDARERVQDLMARRLAGMAAELAVSLADGVECQVCGSVDHPRPASRADDAVTDHDQDLAQQHLLARESALESAVADVQRLMSRRDALTQGAAGLTVAEAATAIDFLQVQLTDVLEAQREGESLDADLRALRAEQEGLGRRRTAAAATAAGLRESVAAHERTLSGVAAEITEALGQQPGSVADVSEELSDLALRLAEAQRALRDCEDATVRAEALTEQARAAASGAGFATLDEVEDALLPDHQRARLETRLVERSATEARARAVLDDPALADLHDEDVELAEDVGSLALAVVEGEASNSDAARALALHEERVTALTAQVERLTEAMMTWAPVRDEALQAESMSRLVRGMGHDNQLQMRLSAYVLATRLDQVVAAANERLGQMRDQRYLLQRTGRAQRRTAQAGLGLEIVDQWTGDVRAPTTLSGGETFVVSLSLALGLADVVTHESGGTEVETLFVDEGFGTLDADTLDDVMDRLDGLRAGGRTVGVVSHVSELRSRIPTQVRVEKARAGSAVTVATLVG